MHRVLCAVNSHGCQRASPHERNIDNAGLGPLGAASNSAHEVLKPLPSLLDAFSVSSVHKATFYPQVTISESRNYFYLSLSVYSNQGQHHA
ncbi:unnamed protein product [Protopolystoma xenopodis]|uniref:Uncharacterized protein n=1 Tax=Protopolystoma xenopodis TaxID=117903 RepID=A0A448WZX2_9PLAT|nr:unnamed protein product [Protopolystoma xenopodis]